MKVESTSTSISVRQSRTTTGKIAFWTFLVCAIFGIAGAIVLTFVAGTPSRDIVITAVCSLLATIFVATRIRWMQVVSAALGLVLLYLVFTEPYVIESWLAPKTDPNGGFYHFVGVVIIAGVAMLACVAGIVNAVQTYRQGSQKMPRWFPTVLGLIAGMVIGALFIGAVAQPATTSGTTFTNGVPTVHMGAGSFLQSSVTITKGSKLMLVDDVNAVHILSNGSWQNNTPRPEREAGAPVVNNLQVNGNSVEIGPFTMAGTYHIYCSVHQGMNLTIIVE
jgi:plastocyanin